MRENEEREKKTKSSSNSTLISELCTYHHDLYTQILANLPQNRVKIQHHNLCKINSVSSKLLVALEGSGRNGMHGCLLTVRRADTFRKTDHIFKSSQRYRILGEFVMSSLLIHPLISSGRQEPLMLWNPCIRKSLRIPLSPLSSFGSLSYTFGFAPCCNDYKVVVMTIRRSQGPQGTDVMNMCVAVYTLSDQQWSLRNDGLNMSISYFLRLLWGYPKPGFFFQGAAHWIGDDPNGDGNSADCSTHLVSLDFDLEKFNYLELPFAKRGRG
ncbi:uncharacterized protein LOC141587595 [Silene latifolia]|uniref:uncharacterized protein LOC141587595 n=1 Tax=Silene latifolia TaxID=37657 RepID=UPI003D770AD1